MSPRTLNYWTPFVFYCRLTIHEEPHHHNSTCQRSSRTKKKRYNSIRRWYCIIDQTCSVQPIQLLRHHQEGGNSNKTILHFLNVVVTMSSHEPSTVQVTLNSIHAISFWTWSSEDDVCAICQNPLDGCAEGCEFPGDDSPVVWGECQHAFHLRCLQQWLQTNNSCPICRRDWKYSSDENKTDAAKAAAAAAAAAAAVPDTATVPAADIVAIATAAAAAAMADT